MMGALEDECVDTDTHIHIHTVKDERHTHKCVCIRSEKDQALYSESATTISLQGKKNKNDRMGERDRRAWVQIASYKSNNPVPVHIAWDRRG